MNTINFYNFRIFETHSILNKSFYQSFLAMRSVLSWLSVSNEKSGIIKNTTAMVTLKDIGLLAHATFIIKFEGKNISGTTVLLLNEKQYKVQYKRIKKDQEICHNRSNSTYLNFKVQNDNYAEWNTKVMMDNIYYPIIVNCNNQNLKYTFNFQNIGTFLDTREMKMPTIWKFEEFSYHVIQFFWLDNFFRYSMVTC